MIIHTDQPKFVEKIYVEDIEYLTRQLGELLKIYRHSVYIDSLETKIVLNKLEEIYRCLQNRQYGMLINDTSIITSEMPGEFIRELDDPNIPF